MFVLLQRLCRVYVVWNCSVGGGNGNVGTLAGVYKYGDTGYLVIFSRESLHLWGREVGGSLV